MRSPNVAPAAKKRSQPSASRSGSPEGYGGNRYNFSFPFAFDSLLTVGTGLRTVLALGRHSSKGVSDDYFFSRFGVPGVLVFLRGALGLGFLSSLPRRAHGTGASSELSGNTRTH